MDLRSVALSRRKQQETAENCSKEIAMGEVPAAPTLGRRRFLQAGAAGLGLMAMGGLAACGQGSSTGGTTNGRKRVNFVTAKFESSTSMQQFVNVYNDSQSKYQVVVRELPPPSSSTEVHQQLVQQLGSSAGGIDVFTEDVIWIAEFASAGFAMNLDQEFSEGERAAFFPGLVEACTYDGSLSAVPFYLDAGQLYYRKDLLEQAKLDVPTSWDDLTSAAQDLAPSSAPLGFLWQGKQAEVLVCNLVEFIGSAGGAILGPDGRTVMIAEPEAEQAVQYMYDTINSLGITPKDVLAWDEEPSRQPFTGGNAAFLRQWSYVWGVSQDPKQSEVVDKVGVAPLPHFDGGSSAACLGGYQLGVAESSQNKDGALDFVRWMTSEDTQLTYAQQFGSAPALQAAYDNPVLEKTQPAMVQLKSTFLGGTPRPVTPKYPQVSLALQSGISEALNSGDIRGVLSGLKSEIEDIVAS
jgi:multiple sugar transport system substrate-binding protein